MSFKKSLIIQILAVILVLTSCSGDTNYETVNTLSASMNVSPSLSPSLSEDTIAVPTATNTQMPVTLPIPLPIPTYRPDYDLSETQQVFISLVQTNGDCSLPCILGIQIAGNKKEVEGYFINLDQGNTSDPYNFSSVYLSDESQGINGMGYFFGSVEEQTIMRFFLDTRFNRAGEVISISLSSDAYRAPVPLVDNVHLTRVLYDQTYQELTQYFSLPSILDQYGPPAQIFFRATTYYSDVDPATFPMILLLYYEDMGFMVEYAFPRETTGTSYVGCPNDGFFSIASVSIGSSVEDNLDRLMNIIDNEWGAIGVQALTQYPTLEEATGETIQDFYDRFTSVGENYCISSPVEYWEN